MLNSENSGSEVGNNFDCPLDLHNGLFRLNFDHRNPKLWNEVPFVIQLGSETFDVDHVAIAVAGASRHEQMVEDFVASGAQIVEGPGIWPDDFCEHLDDIGPELSMRFATIKLQSNHLLVLCGPAVSGDKLDQLCSARGGDTVHHVAIRAQEFTRVAEIMTAQGWTPMTKEPVSDGVLRQWFLRDEAGQILELIARANEDSDTFSCGNITGLRRSE